jgi:hypothetical protein
MGDQYAFSAHAETGGTATVVNHVFIQNLQRRWTRPAPPALDRDAVPRPAEMTQVKAELASRGAAAITGKAASFAMQGAPGVGKTTLARLLALDLDADTPDGVIWEDLGPDFIAAEQAQAVLRRWAGYATSFFDLGENLSQLFTFEPAAVRSLLSEHSKLLVVLDNVWSLAAIQPLRDALPPGSRLIVTTRSRAIAQGLAAGWVEVGLLNEAEALDLFDLRLRWRPQNSQPADRWAFDLASGVGMHALGLDVALGVLRRYGDTPTEWRAAADRLLGEVRDGRFDRLSLGDDDPGHNVKAVMMFSYEALKEDAQSRFRWLAAFAAEADFTTEAAAAIWGCDPDEAFETLTDFANAALLERRGGGAWRQHALLRTFGLALLRDAGETDAAAAAHARAYAAAMRRADDAQRYHEMLLPALPQLRHAFEWALANDLDLALHIAANCANLQKQFGLAREGGEWSERALEAAEAHADPETLAFAWFHRGNRLSDIAGLPGEDRRARLLAALAAYDVALQHYRPDAAPPDYAMTQNNRAILLGALAGLAGEDRRARLGAALAACDEALRYYRPDTAPLAYAVTQNNRATLLRELAGLTGEDRRARLGAALAACDEALRFRRPDTAPLAYAMTQNNRATLLSEMAGLPGEDRRGRLLEALAAYDAALQHYRPDTAPLAYAATQNNRATLLRHIAGVPGEDRRARLGAALAACDEALRYYRPDTAPPDYAMTQDNRANLLGALAGLPGEDRRVRLGAALAACDEALRFRRPDTAPLAYAVTQNNRAPLLRELAGLPGEDRRARLGAALAACDEALRFRRPDTAPLDYAVTQINRGFLLNELAGLAGEDRRARLLEALQCAWEAHGIFVTVEQAQYQAVAEGVLRDLRSECGDASTEIWAAAGLGAPPGWLAQDEDAGLIRRLASRFRRDRKR